MSEESFLIIWLIVTSIGFVILAGLISRGIVKNEETIIISGFWIAGWPMVCLSLPFVLFIIIIAYIFVGAIEILEKIKKN